MPRAYEQISRYEREVIAQMRKEAAGWTVIGRRLGRAPSTIYREYHRNRSEEGYLPHRADEEAAARRRVARRPRRIVGPVGRWVTEGLRRYWSPDQIQGRGVKEGQAPLSFMTIYRYLERPEGMRYRRYLRGPSPQRRQNRTVRERIHDRVMIDQRPPEAEGRTQVGHWEGDTVRGPMKSSACVMSLVERTSQFLVARRLAERSAEQLNDSARQAMKGLPFKTLTVDNGMEFASHKKLEELTGASIYFAHEKSPWERGLNEQVNGLIRQFFPKGTDFSKVSPAQLRRVVTLLNQRPRKSLGYKTPNEVMRSQIFALVK